MSDRNLLAAEKLLQEAVYQARARQAAGVGLAARSLDAPAPPGGCGLGDALEEELELSDAGLEIARKLWPRSLTPLAAQRIRDILQEWVERQDALDRKRNHYLRDFRQAHGFDRRAYPAEVAREFEEGLERINAEVAERLRRAARELLRAGEFPPGSEAS